MEQREMKFRARLKCRTVVNDTTHYDERITTYFTLDYIVNSPFNLYDFAKDEGYNRVIEGAYEEYSGMDDKNDVEIYEGDIATISTFSEYPGSAQRNITGVVRMFEGGWCVEEEELHIHVINDRVEVIGNIYDDPELLEGE